ncbi:MAG: ABC transporter permease, partial [Verrucomicrobiales bacterium]|nr:ABC transporter permease [Verrucomicrobiales bacterium]
MITGSNPALRLLFSPAHLRRTVPLGLKSIWLHRLRSMLTALGVVFGVASVVAMLAIGEGASYEAQEQIRKLGSQNIILDSVKPPASQGNAGEERSLVIEYGLTRKDLQQIDSTVPGIEVVVPSREVVETLWSLERKIEGRIVGALPIYPEVKNRTILQGRFFSQMEFESHLPTCVISEGTAVKLFPLSSPVGKSIRVRGFYYRIIGVIEELGGASVSDSADQTQGEMLIPYPTLLDQFGETFFRYKTGGYEAEKVEFHQAIIKVAHADEVESRATAIREILRHNHKKDDWNITVPVELLKQAERTKQIFSIVLGSIAAISLLVGGIGIMNIMLVRVTERTREIG